MAVLVAGVVAPVATAQARPESPILSDHDIFGELTEWAAGGWRLGDSANRSNSSMPAAPGLRLERSVVQVRSQTPSASSPSAISGYMDFHFNNVEHQDARLDFHRFVLLFTHSFSDRVRFVSELELEHAFVEGLEEAGELELEQAYIDFLVTRELNFRAGMLLVPVGIINERHEPPVYHGV